MKFNRLFLLLCIGCFAAVVPSCKKKDQEHGNPLPYLKGKLKLTTEIPLYVRKGEVYEIEPTGITKPDGGDVGYFWMLSTKKVVRDTVKREGSSGTGKFRFVVPDTLATMSLTCTAFAKGYSNSSASIKFTIVDPDKSVTNTGISSLPFEKDARDGKKVYYVTVGDKQWTAKNIAFEGMGKPYLSEKAMTDVFGMYYTFEEAKNVCPAGWHLPSLDEWKSLLRFVKPDYEFKGTAGALMGDAYFNGMKMWEFQPSVKITNLTGLNALPVGYAIVQKGGYLFKGSLDYAAFWTSDERNNGQGIYIYINSNQPNVMQNAAGGNVFAASVRCVR